MGTAARGDEPLFRRHVRRPRLTKLLDDSRAQAIVLAAPPGYGKTVVATEWAQGRRNVVWYRATPASADLAAFALAVAEAAEPLARGTSELMRNRVRAGVGDEGARTLAELLAPAVEDWPADGVLVVDDYHLVQESRSAEEFTDWLLTLTPIRLLATTRTRPSWASARRVLYGEVVEVGRDQLALTEAEVLRVLADLPAPAARAAAERANGWPALVALAAVSPPTNAPPHALSDALYRYFADEVLRSEPPEVQRFMTAAAAALTLDLDTAHALGIVDPDPAIARLLDEGLLEQVGHAYRFHPLLRNFLRTKLSVNEPERAVTLADAAAKHAVEAGRLEEAFELARESGRVERAAEIAAAAARDLLVAGRTETLERWLDICGTAALLQPPLVLARASLLLRRGQIADAASVAHDVASRLDPDDPHLSRAWYVTAQANQLLCRWTDALEGARLARAAAATRDDRMNALLLAMLAGAALELDLDEELEELEALAANDVRARFRLASAQIRAALSSPSLAGTWERVAALIPLVDHCDGPMLKSDVLAGAAYLNVLRAEYHTAAALAEQAAAVSAEAKLRLPHAFSTLYLAAAEVGLRRFGKAERALAAVDDAVSLDRRGLRIARESVRLRLALARGERIVPKPLADLVVDGTSPRQQALYEALAALAAATAGAFADARTRAASARALSRSAEAQLCASAAEVVAGLRSGVDVSGAVASLFEASLAADVPDAVILAYRACPDVLTIAADDARTASLARPLVRRAGDEELGRDAGLLAPAENAAVHEVLTPREAEVLALMAEGLSNADIARRLYISPSTTKVHVHHILEKLGSKSRFEAVLKAGQADRVNGETKGGST